MLRRVVARLFGRPVKQLGLRQSFVGMVDNLDVEGAFFEERVFNKQDDRIYEWRGYGNGTTGARKGWAPYVPDAERVQHPPVASADIAMLRLVGMGGHSEDIPAQDPQWRVRPGLERAITLVEAAASMYRRQAADEEEAFAAETLFHDAGICDAMADVLRDALAGKIDPPAPAGPKQVPA